MKSIISILLVSLGTAGQAQNSDIFGGSIGDGWSFASHTQVGNDIYGGGIGDGWSSAQSSMTTLAVNQTDFDNRLQIYPNPTAGELDIVFPEATSTAFVQVIDMNGRLIEEIQVANSHSIPVVISGSSGVYIVNITADGKSASYKVIKK